MPAGATKRGDTPQSRLSTLSGDVETAIWSYDSETQQLSAQWVNEAVMEPTVPTSILGRRDSNGMYSFMLSRRLGEDDDSVEDSDDSSVDGLYDSDEDDDFVEIREASSKDGDSVGGGDSVEAREDTLEDGDSVVVCASFIGPGVRLTMAGYRFSCSLRVRREADRDRLMTRGRGFTPPLVLFDTPTPTFFHPSLF